MANKTSLHRLRKEFRNITREPPPHITARPLPSNILKWYFVLEGPKGTAYEGGIFMGRLVFPEQYPYKPPAVYMCTPQGRFKCNQKLCLSMSDFHPETWNPLWSVSAVLTGLLSFMLGSEDTVGSIQTNRLQKVKMARASHQFNRTDKIFVELFPEFIRTPNQLTTSTTSSSTTTTTTTTTTITNTTTNHNHNAGTMLQHRNGTGTGVGGKVQQQQVEDEDEDMAHNSSARRQRRRGAGDNESESLLSLIMWLFVFIAFIFAVFKLIAGS